jgi:hypothetical protein
LVSGSTATPEYADYILALPYFQKRLWGFDNTITILSAQNQLPALDRKVHAIPLGAYMRANSAQMKHKISSARSTDLSSLSSVMSPLIMAALNYYGQPPTKIIFCVQNYAQRGIGSNECFRHLVPRADVDQFDADPEKYASLRPWFAYLTLLRRYKDYVDGGVIQITASKSPLVMYTADISFDPEAPLNGLFVGEMMARVSRLGAMRSRS